MGKSLLLPLPHWTKTLQAKPHTINTWWNLTNYSLSALMVLWNFFVLQEVLLQSFLTFPFLLPHLFLLTVDHLEDLLHGHLLLPLAPAVHLHPLPPLPRLLLHLRHHHPLLCRVLCNVCLESYQLKVIKVNILLGWLEFRHLQLFQRPLLNLLVPQLLLIVNLLLHPLLPTHWNVRQVVVAEDSPKDPTIHVVVRLKLGSKNHQFSSQFLIDSHGMIVVDITLMPILWCGSCPH